MDEEKHEGLPVLGYRPQANSAVMAVNLNKNFEEMVLAQLDALAGNTDLDVDKRWLAIGRTAIEQGFMAVNRAVFKPARAVTPPAAVTENDPSVPVQAPSTDPLPAAGSSTL